MSVTLTIRDETAAGKVYSEMSLELPSERVTVRELIRRRVYQEVQDFNRRQDEIFRGLVQPTDTERILNGHKTEYRLKHHRPIDWKQQFEKALEAFEENRFLVIVNDTQVASLDDEFTVDAHTQVSFVKLVMLVGG